MVSQTTWIYENTGIFYKNAMKFFMIYCNATFELQIDFLIQIRHTLVENML